MNIRSILAAGLAAFCIAGAAAPSRAALVSVDDARFGPGGVTRDSETGLEWLDLLSTTGLWPERVLFHLRPGGRLDGWRYATLAEVGELFRHAGIPDLTIGVEPVRWTEANHLPVLALIELVDVLYPYGCFTNDCPVSEGITGTSPVPGEPAPDPVEGPPGTGKQYYLTATLAACGGCGSFDEIHNLGSAVLGGGLYAQDAAGWPGSWLVRDAAATEIAEPGALLLFGGGLLALAGLASRRRAAGRAVP